MEDKLLEKSEQEEPVSEAAEISAEPEAKPEKSRKSKTPDTKAVFSSVSSICRAIFVSICSFLSYIGVTTIKAVKKTSSAVSHWTVRTFSASVRCFTDGIKPILRGLFDFLYKIGSCAWGALTAIVTAVYRAIRSFCTAFFGTIFGWVAKKMKQPLYEVWCFILTPFAHAWGYFAHAHIHLKKARKRGFWHAVGSFFTSLWKFFGGVGEFLRFIFNYAAPVISIIFLVSLIRYSSTLQYAISVEYNGNELGTIENEAAYNEAQTLINDKVTFTEDAAPILSTPKFSVTVLNLSENENQPVSDIDTLSEMMIETGEVSIVYAYGLYINDELIGVYSPDEMEKIRTALNDRLNQYNIPNAVNVYFEDDIVISEGRFIESVLVPADGALELINGSKRVEAYYKVKSGDSISGICEELNITREEFDTYNPGLSEGIRAGDFVTYHYLEPNLNVLTTYYEVYDQVIERTTEYVQSSRYEQYCEILLQHGSDGYENVTALITETNGVETDRQIVSRTVLEEMVPRKFRVGTKENTYLEGNTTVIDKLGTFVWPVADEDCYISSDYGWRSWDSSNHKAIDIAGIPRGTDIYAACDGKVTFSGWYAAYGKLVIIDCGSGYECYYGHCSELLVSVGDRVEKGDVIAEVGMTGSASGNHLHFEMRYHDERINPFLALGGPGGHRFNI